MTRRSLTRSLTRRSFATLFGKAAAVLGLGSLVSVTTACPAWLSNLYADILKYAPVALAGLSAVLAILTGNGIAISPLVSAALALVKVGLADLQTAVTQYQNAPAGQKTGLLGAISEALTVTEANLQQFWNDLTIPDAKLAALVEGLLGVISTTLAGFATQLPATVTPVAAQARARRAVLAKLLPATPVKRSVARFRSDFNAILKQAGEGQHAI